MKKMLLIITLSSTVIHASEIYEKIKLLATDNPPAYNDYHTSGQSSTTRMTLSQHMKNFENNFWVLPSKPVNIV